MPAHHTAWKAWLRFTVGVTMVASGVTSIIRADLGASPLDALNLALADASNLSFAYVATTLALAMVGVAYLLGVRPRLGTVVAAAVLGPMIGFGIRTMPIPTTLGGALSLFAFGLITLAIGIAVYSDADLGVAPLEGLTRSISQNRIPYFGARIFLEGSFATLAVIFGGTISFATVAVVVTLGPLVSLTHARLIPATYRTTNTDTADI